MPSRRSLLAGLGSMGATIPLAGCFWDVTNDSSLTLEMESVSRDELGQARVRPVAEQGPWVRQVVARGLENGTTVYGRKPLERSDFLDVDGTYYAVHVSKNGTATVERPVLEATEVAAPDGPVNDWGNVSRADGLTLRCAVSTRDRNDLPGCVIYGGNESAFLPKPRFRYLESGEETYYRLEVEERPVDLDRYEYSFESVAETRSAFAEYVARERVAIDFSTGDLTAEQRDILETAAAEGTYEESPPPYSAALQELVDRIERTQQRSGTYEIYVRFEGEYYRLSYQQFFDG